MFKIAEDFLINKGAKKIGHGSKSLYSHLINTGQLLREWDCDIICQTAGLLHNIYGTVEFGSKLVKLEDRLTIRSIFGKEIERLVYLFCSVDRREIYNRSEPFFVNISENNIKYIEKLSVEEVTWMVEIEIANGLDIFPSKKLLPLLKYIEITERIDTQVHLITSKAALTYLKWKNEC
jgi:(p)ppGpp synthase/HD superfamily hydrolase